MCAQCVWAICYCLAGRCSANPPSEQSSPRKGLDLNRDVFPQLFCLGAMAAAPSDQGPAATLPRPADRLGRVRSISATSPARCLSNRHPLNSATDPAVHNGTRARLRFCNMGPIPTMLLTGGPWSLVTACLSILHMYSSPRLAMELVHSGNGNTLPRLDVRDPLWLRPHTSVRRQLPWPSSQGRLPRPPTGIQA